MAQTVVPIAIATVLQPHHHDQKLVVKKWDPICVESRTESHMKVGMGDFLLLSSLRMHVTVSIGT